MSENDGGMRLMRVSEEKEIALNRIILKELSKHEFFHKSDNLSKAMNYFLHTFFLDDNEERFNICSQKLKHVFDPLRKLDKKVIQEYGYQKRVAEYDELEEYCNYQYYLLSVEQKVRALAQIQVIDAYKR